MLDLTQRHATQLSCRGQWSDYSFAFV